MAVKNGNMEDEYFGTPLGSGMVAPFSLVAGDIIRGKISKIDEEFVYVSTGFKSESRIPLKEFRPDEEGKIEFNLEDEVEVMVNHVGEENISLSYANVADRRKWEKLKVSFDEKEPIEGKIMQQVKGGYRVDVGVSKHAFMPGSHLGVFTKEGESLVGSKYQVLIIEFDQAKENVVVSHRDLQKRESAKLAEQAFSEIQVGSVIDGTVTRLAKFGAFVDIGGVDGLVHISEISHARVANPSSALKEGQAVQVKVLDVNPEQKRISLSIKQALPDPWDNIKSIFTIDEVIVGKVSKIVKFGAFIMLRDGYEGLLHISEIESGDDKKNLSHGDEIKVKVSNIDSENRRIKLTLAQVLANKVPSEMKQYIDTGSGGVTLGDMLNGALDS